VSSITALPGRILARARSFGRRRPKGTAAPLFRRNLEAAEADLLAGQLSRAFEAPLTAGDVQEAAACLRSAEARMIGRIAGDVEDHVLNYYMVHHSSRQCEAVNAAHAEIGILFGGGLLMMLQALRSADSRHMALAIDPLDGYYGQNLDPFSGLPISSENVEENIRRLGFEMDRVHLLKLRSESPEALAAASRFSLASLWIDGDHSYEGVKRDWQNYSPLVMPGGYVLFDNYHDGYYPGVDRFLDRDLLPDLGGWMLAAKLGRSILLRKRSRG
jgi:hypothetical protein